MPVWQLVANLVIGGVFIALGLLPGPLARLKEGIENFRDVLFGFPTRENDRSRERLPGQIWLAVAGAAVILINVLAYFTP